MILPTQKPKREHFYSSNLVYKFQCDCSSSYIGHTKQLFESRIYQHKTHPSSHVFKHITTCNLYKQKLLECFGADPNGNCQREFIKNHFSILEKNLYNWYKRTTHEGLMITLQNPDLNKPVFHKSMTFMCECAGSKNKEPLPNTDTVGT